MAQGKFVTYCRVSTERQGRSGLGLEAQRSAVTTFLNGGQWSVVGEFVEVESGARDDRPELSKALALCRVHGAVLLIAKLDRLSRDLHFLTGLQKAGVRFVATDMPEANETMVGFMAIMAQAERKAISTRTKAALAEAKKRGVVMGGFRGYIPGETDRKASLDVRQARAAARGADLTATVREMQANGTTSLGGLAKALTEAGIPTARGASVWSPMQVSRLLTSIGAEV